MSTILRFGRTLITLTDDAFSNGFQVGYLHFKKDVQRKLLTNSFLMPCVRTKHVYVSAQPFWQSMQHDIQPPHRPYYATIYPYHPILTKEF